MLDSPDGAAPYATTLPKSRGKCVAHEAHLHSTGSAALPENPFHTPDLMLQSRSVKLQAARTSARGLRILFVDAKVWFWFITHFGTLGLIICLDKPFRESRFSALTFSPTATTRDYVHTAVWLACAALFIGLYRFLYASDPCYLPSAAALELAVQRAQPGEHPCHLCGARPTSRSKHSRAAGQCVHKFDHSCWMLSTDIGDRTHGAFVVYMYVEIAWVLWGIAHLARIAWRCGAASGAPECDGVTAAGRGLAIAALSWTTFALIPFGYLVVLQTYLVATNQTTVEIIKGAGVRYLAPHFCGKHECKRPYDLPTDLPRLFADELRGCGPPKPFDRGVWRNLVQLVCERWPRHYEAAVPPQPLSSLAV